MHLQTESYKTVHIVTKIQIIFEIHGYLSIIIIISYYIHNKLTYIVSLAM